MTARTTARPRSWRCCASSSREMLELLRALAAAESPSRDAGRAAAGPRRCSPSALDERGFGPSASARPATSGRPPARRPRRRRPGDGAQLLLGHLDTVWPVGTLAEMPLLERDGRALRARRLRHEGRAGPGSLFALRRARRARPRAGADPGRAHQLRRGDRQPRLPRAHRRGSRATAARAFVLEPSFGPGGALKTARKGVGRFTSASTARRATPASSPSRASARSSSSHTRSSRLFELNDLERGMTVNVGTIDGGLRRQRDRPRGERRVDARVPDGRRRGRIEQAIRALEPVPRGDPDRGRRRLRPSAARAHAAQPAALGRRPGSRGAARHRARGGAPSAAPPTATSTSALTATLDGLGAVGDGAHAPRRARRRRRGCPSAHALLALLLLEPPARRA